MASVQQSGEVGGQDPSLGDLLGRLSSSTSELVAAEVALARAEVKEELTRASKGAALGAGAAAVGLVALGLFGAAVAWGLAEVVEPGWAFLIVTVLYLAGAAVLALAAKRAFQQVEPVPETVQSLKEDVQWARQQLS